MDETVVITGATTPLAPNVARAVAAEGAHVVIAGRKRDVATDIADEIEAAGGTATPEFADARDEFDMERLMETASRVGGGIDAVIPAESVAHEQSATELVDASYSAYDDTLRTNTRGAFTAIREAVPHLADDGRIVIPVTGGGHAGTGPFVVSQSALVGVMYAFSETLEQAVGAVEVSIIPETATDEELDAAADHVAWALSLPDDALDGVLLDEVEA